MTQKKVAVLLPWLKMGGTNKIALSFMKELSQYCDVTLILTQKTGELLAELPENIHLIVDEMQNFQDIFKEDIKKCRLSYLIRDLIYYYNVRIGRDTIDNYRYFACRHGYITDTEFDCAISYHGQSPERLINLLYRIHSRKKVAWIHGEFNNSEDHYRRMERYYSQMDQLFFVSNPTVESFANKMKLDRSKATVYYNPIDKGEIIERSILPCTPPFSSEFMNIVTVGRISSEKGQDMVPAVTRNLLDLGHRIRWYLIGDGPSRGLVEQNIREQQVEESVILLGTQNNPYCYMRACDLYVQPSYTEGYSTTICEAGMLGKAIVGTKPSGGIRDQIIDGRDGLIVDATVDGLTAGIHQLLSDNSLRHQFETEIQKKNFEGKGEIQKFLDFLEK